MPFPWLKLDWNCQPAEPQLRSWPCSMPDHLPKNCMFLPFCLVFFVLLNTKSSKCTSMLNLNPLNFQHTDTSNKTSALDNSRPWTRAHRFLLKPFTRNTTWASTQSPKQQKCSLYELLQGKRQSHSFAWISNSYLQMQQKHIAAYGSYFHVFPFSNTCTFLPTCALWTQRIFRAFIKATYSLKGNNLQDSIIRRFVAKNKPIRHVVC